jgi:hypothetical protein
MSGFLSQRRRPTPPGRTWLALAAVLLLLPGCVTVYHPLVSLQRPVAIDPGLPNFQGQRVLLRCFPGEYLRPKEAAILCRHVRRLFTNQGARVQAEVPRGAVNLPAGAGPKAARPDLIIDLQARLLHEENSALLWIVSGLSLTLIPAITDTTFAQDVTIRDADGALLLSDTLQGRFVNYFGFGTWAVNATLDLLVRGPSEDLTGDAAEEDFSRDFYRQLSQLAFHARMRSRVMHGFTASPPRAAR